MRVGSFWTRPDSLQMGKDDWLSKCLQCVTLPVLEQCFSRRPLSDADFHGTLAMCRGTMDSGTRTPGQRHHPKCQRRYQNGLGFAMPHGTRMLCRVAGADTRDLGRGAHACHLPGCTQRAHPRQPLAGAGWIHALRVLAFVFSPSSIQTNHSKH